MKEMVSLDRAVKVSVIVPIADELAWSRCKASIDASIGAYCGNVVFDVVECRDLHRLGVERARNEGLARADGDWLAWVDCDDEVEREWCTVIARCVGTVEEAHPEEVDVFCFGAEMSGTDGCGHVMRYSAKESVVPASRFLRDVLCDIGGSTWLWNKVFRRRLFVGLRFEGPTQEDFRIMPRVMARARNVKSIPCVLYRYMRPVGSLTHNGGGGANARGILAAIGDELDDVPCKDMILGSWKEGCALRAADWLRHCGSDAGLASFLRRNVWRVLLDGRQTLRVKAKCLVAAIGVPGGVRRK